MLKKYKLHLLKVPGLQPIDTHTESERIMPCCLSPPKQTYENENENENRFRNRRKTTSVDTRKRETQTVKLNLVVFGFDTFPRKKPLV